MIALTYDGSKEPALGMHIASLGKALVQVDDGWQTTSTQAVVDAFSVSDAHPYCKVVVEGQAATVRERLFGHIDTYERDSWATKLEQATAFDATKDNADAPMLAAEATARSTTTQAVTDRVLTNSTTYQAVIGAVSGRAGALKDAIDAATTWAELSTVMAGLETGWPG